MSPDPSRRTSSTWRVRTNEVRGHLVKLVPTWSGPFSESMSGNVLLPGPDARIAATTFDEWLAAGAT